MQRPPSILGLGGSFSNIVVFDHFPESQTYFVREWALQMKKKP